MSLRSSGRADFGKVQKTSVSTATKTVSVAGTAEQLSSMTVPSGFELVIKALSSNTDKVHVASTKAGAETQATSYELSAGEAVMYKVTNADALWVDANVSNEGVTITVEA